MGHYRVRLIVLTDKLECVTELQRTVLQTGNVLLEAGSITDPEIDRVDRLTVELS